MKNTKIQCYRHGEIAFEVIKELPTGLSLSKNKTFLVGSNSNPHSYDNGKWYPQFSQSEKEIILGYFIADNTTLLHKEHGIGKGESKKAKLPNGFFRVRKQFEIVNKELKQIVD